jgi:hypothetical protein
MTSTLDWFKALDDKHKALFLAMAGGNLTDSALHAAADELKALNEICNRLYKAIARLLVAGNKPFDADNLWDSLNELAKPSHLDVALEAAFAGAKSMAQTFQGLKA